MEDILKITKDMRNERRDYIKFLIDAGERKADSDVITSSYYFQKSIAISLLHIIDLLEYQIKQV